ncbi:hypothetical protein BT96DRAFT_1008952 [Gymnopus androsaceus JB14]|uniref:Uncharacterized protein n=1 Tax=Gymnopus androsaceus JB14 TaxID=1447944 RepID=A0A6A4GDX4_9AGAR|nr:hypothetical protein BT96DRAFT_1008952 [Gymnopus androsaceus JB14]
MLIPVLYDDSDKQQDVILVLIPTNAFLNLNISLSISTAISRIPAKQAVYPPSSKQPPSNPLEVVLGSPYVGFPGVLEVYLVLLFFVNSSISSWLNIGAPPICI